MFNLVDSRLIGLSWFYKKTIPMTLAGRAIRGSAFRVGASPTVPDPCASVRWRLRNTRQIFCGRSSHAAPDAQAGQRHGVPGEDRSIIPRGCALSGSGCIGGEGGVAQARRGSPTNARPPTPTRAIAGGGRQGSRGVPVIGFDWLRRRDCLAARDWRRVVNDVCHRHGGTPSTGAKDVGVSLRGATCSSSCGPWWWTILHPSLDPLLAPPTPRWYPRRGPVLSPLCHPPSPPSPFSFSPLPLPHPPFPLSFR